MHCIAVFGEIMDVFISVYTCIAKTLLVIRQNNIMSQVVDSLQIVDS